MGGLIIVNANQLRQFANEILQSKSYADGCTCQFKTWLTQASPSGLHPDEDMLIGPPATHTAEHS